MKDTKIAAKRQKVEGVLMNALSNPRPQKPPKPFKGASKELLEEIEKRGVNKKLKEIMDQSVKKEK